MLFDCRKVAMTQLPANESTAAEAPNSDAPRSRLPSLTGARWVAVVLVFVYHMTWGVFPLSAFPESFTFYTAKMGWVGVSFFFILSGFVMAWSARPDDTATRFWRRRFFKIYPNHLATAGLAMVLMVWAGTQIVHVVPNLLLVQSWSPDPQVSLSVNGPSWSLACEAFFYLLFPLWHRLVGRIRPERLWFAAAGLIAVVLCIPLGSLLLPDTPLLAWEPTPAYDWWFVYLFPVTRTVEFLLGIVMARIVLSGRWIDVPLWAVTTLCVVGYAASLYVPNLWSYTAATVIPFALAIPALAVHDVKGRRSFLATSTMVWLGNVSFAFYLLHRILSAHMVFLFGPEFTWTTVNAVAVTGLAFVVSLGLSWALHSLWEVPIQRRFARPRTPKAGRTQEVTV